MERLTLIRLFLPRKSSVFLYWFLLLFWVLAVAVGLREQPSGGGTLWGLELRFPGRNARESMINAHIEFMYHGWVLLGLPFAVLRAVRPVATTFRPDYLLFAKFSRTSPFYLELWRAGGMLLAWTIASFPFLVGALVGTWHPGLSWNEAAGTFAACVVPLLVLMVYVYLLSSLGIPTEITISTALVLCFFLEGIAIFAERNFQGDFLQFLPGRLPYSIAGWDDPVVLGGAVFSLLGISLQLGRALRSRCLR